MHIKSTGRRKAAVPARVKVGWRAYAVSALVDSDNAGECDPDHGTIKIKPGDDAHMAHTLLHEILHACYDQAALRRKDGEERVVAGLANTLAQVLRDNPGVGTFILTGLTHGQ